MPTIEVLNALGIAWASAMARSLVDASVVLVIVFVVWLPLRRRISSQMAYGLFVLVLVKAAFPVPVELPAWVHRIVPRSAADGLLPPIQVRSAAVLASRRNQPPHADRPRNPPPAEDTTPVAGLANGLPASNVVSTNANPISHASSRPNPSDVALKEVPPSLSTYAVLMFAWTTITATLLARLICVHARMSIRLRNAADLDTSALKVDYRSLCARCGLRYPVPLLVTPLVSSPAAFGLLRPRVLVPPGLTESLGAGQLTWVLLHELIHVRRRDAWVASFQRLVQIAYVFHPAVWVANRLIDLQREYACDDAAIALSSDVPRRDCAAGFLVVIERAGARAAGASPALGLFGSHYFLRRRMMRILDSNRTPRRRLSVSGRARTRNAVHRGIAISARTRTNRSAAA